MKNIKFLESIWNDIWKTSSDIINFLENKSIKIKFKDNCNNFHCIVIDFDINFVPHSLGIDKFPYFFKMKHKWGIAYWIRNHKEINIEKAFYRVSKEQIWKIKEKLQAWYEIFDFLKKISFDKLRITSKLKFATHNCDFMLIMNNGSFVLCKKEDTELFYECYIKSVRYLNQNKIEKYEFIDVSEFISFEVLQKK